MSDMMNGLPGAEPSWTITAWPVSERRTSCPAAGHDDGAGLARGVGEKDDRVLGPGAGGAVSAGAEAHPEKTAKESRHAARMPGIAKGRRHRSLVTHARRHCGTGSPTWTAKRVPRMPMVAVGVSNRADSGESFPIRPDR